MRALTPILLALLGCSDAPEALRPPPALSVTLSGPATIVPGTTVTFELALPPGTPERFDVYFPIGTEGLGPGICPPELDGACLGIQGAPVLIGQARSLGDMATFTIDVPNNIPVDSVAIQAVVDTWLGPVFSDAIEIPVDGSQSGGGGGGRGACPAGTTEVSGTLPSLHQAAMDLVPMNQATHMAVASGDWSDPTTWNQGVPGDGARVIVPMGTTVTLDTVTDDLESVGIGGTLRVAPDMDTQLRVDTLVSMASGALEIGTASAPIQPDVSAGILFLDDGPVDPVTDPSQIGRGAALMGRTTIVGADKLDWTALATAPAAGATTLQLTQVPVGWRLGDELAIASTDPIDPTADEVRVITQIQGTRVTLDRPLALDHLPLASDLEVHVANLTRNITIASESSEVNRRGHVMFMHTLDVDVRHAAFSQLGRTDKRVPVDDLLYPDLEEGPICMGQRTNIRGRYSLHFHRGGTSPTSTPAHVEGNVVRDDPGWAYVSHSAHVDFVSNVSYDIIGGAFQTEAGDEIGSFVGNIALRTVNPALPLRSDGEEAIIDAREPQQDFAFQGDGFWLHGGGVRVEDNVVSGASGHAYVIWPEGLVEEDGNMTRVPPSMVPNGALWGNTPLMDIWWIPMSSFARNQAYGSTIGLEIYYLHATFLDRFDAPVPEPYLDTLNSTFEDLTLWGMHTRGIGFHYAENLTLRNIRLVGDGRPGVPGIDADHFHMLDDYVFEDIEVRNFDVGVEVPTQGRITFRRGTYANRTDFRITNPQIAPRTLRFEDITFGTPAGVPASARTKFLMDPYFGFNVGPDEPSDRVTMFLLMPDRITLDFGPFTNEGLFFDEQRADFVPMTAANRRQDGRVIPARYLDLTNQQLDSRFNLSFGGALLPGAARVVPEVVGGQVGPAAAPTNRLPPDLD